MNAGPGSMLECHYKIEIVYYNIELHSIIDWYARAYYFWYIRNGDD